MKVNDLIFTLFKMIGMVIGAACVGIFLLWMVYLLPTESMAKNVVASETTLRGLDDAKSLSTGVFWDVYDLGTNIIMFHEVVFPSKGEPFQEALLAPTADYIKYWNENWTDVLIQYATDREYNEDDYVTYPRYWHGYLIFLKPLFMFMDLQGIIILNTLALIVLTIVNAYLMKKRLGIAWIAYILAIVLMHPANIVQSFQLSSIFYAMQITLLLLLWKENLKKEQLAYIFVIDGILVAFFDFLTYPFVAFAVPALTCYMIYKKEDFKKDFLNIFFNGVAFGLGYAGMWGMKWIIATLFTDVNVIADAIGSVLHRTGVTSKSVDSNFLPVSVKDALHANFVTFFHESNIMICTLSLVFIVVLLILRRKSLYFNKWLLVFYGAFAVSPFLWIVLLKNHCSLHPHLEWRTFVVLVYAILLFFVELLFSKKTVIKEKGNTYE